jgi:Transposase and inactivated derivatives
MDVCLLDQAGETLLHRHMTATPAALLKAIAPYRAQIVLAAEGMFPWYWLADLWAEHGMPLVLGHALSMKAIPGGKAKNDKIDAHKIAVLLRGGMLPQASVSPAERRATRDLLRRRMHLARKRGALLAPVHNTNRPYHLPAIGTKSAYKTHRDGVAERCAAPAVPKSLAVALALLTSDDELWRDIALPIVTTAKHHDAHTLSLRPTVPGLGKLLRLGLRYDIPQIDRCPRVQDFASSCRRGTGAKASAGKRSGTSGTTIGKAHLTWAFSAAAVLCLRDHPAGQTFRTRLEKKQSKGKALPI